jgi:hypothetical protein
VDRLGFESDEEALHRRIAPAIFFGGAMHAVLLLQKGLGYQLGSDIAGFILEEPQDSQSLISAA